jgi:hypothetical protein
MAQDGSGLLNISKFAFLANRTPSVHAEPIPRRREADFGLSLSSGFDRLAFVTAETFRKEIGEALKVYDRYIVCLDKTPDEFEAALISLLNKAIKAYETRGPQLRHGIALDRHITVILSQTEGPRPLCGIYFNLHSPYQKSLRAKTPKPAHEPISGGAEV